MFVFLCVGYCSTRVVLGGFSQGAALALQAACQYGKPLGGVICLSGWLPRGRHPTDQWQPNDAAKATPILVCHGWADCVVTSNISKQSVSVLGAAGFQVTHKTYAGLAHSSSPLELEDVAQFMLRVVPVEFVDNRVEKEKAAQAKPMENKVAHTTVLRNPAWESLRESDPAEQKTKATDITEDSPEPELEEPAHSLTVESTGVTVKVKLPLLEKMSEQVKLDLNDTSVKLTVEGMYVLAIDLPQVASVDTDKATARFNKNTRTLKIEIPFLDGV